MTQTYYNAVLLLGFFISFIVGTAIYSRQRKSVNNGAWFAVSIFASLWSIFYFFTINTNNKDLAFILVICANIFAVLVTLSWIYFINIFLDIYKKRLYKNIFLGISLAGLFVIGLNFTPGFIGNMEPKYIFNYYVEPGIGYYIYTAYLLLAIISGFFLMFKFFKKLPQEKETQAKYIIIASALGFIGGLNVFLLAFNIFFPPYLLILFMTFPLAIVYAMAKHHLFDIKIIATELLSVAIWLLLLTKLFFSVDYQDFIFNIFILIGVVLAGILLVRSVTKEVLQREKIEKMAKDLERAYEVEKKANAELEKLDKYKNDFLRQTQHDLRSPLSVLMGYTDLLIEDSYGKIPKSAKDVLLKMQDVVQAKIKDVNNFLDVEQFKLGKGVVALKPGVELAPILEEITKTLSSKALSKGIDLRLQKTDETIFVSADTEKLKAALFNIIDNAVKYTEKGSVSVAVTKNSGFTALIEVEDTGIGIPQDKVKNIFGTQFERTEQAKKTASGSGVGLYLSGQIIKMHNGKAWAESKGDGKGSAFYIELPLGGE
jgi:signal transduction histidine kinase